MTDITESLVFAFMGLCALLTAYWIGHCAGIERTRIEYDALKLKHDDLRKWVEGIDKEPTQVMQGDGHLYVLFNNGQIYRRMCDEKGNFEEEWEEVTGSWKTTGAT